jgi:hypothetical protein
MYIRPLLFASGPMLGLAPLAQEYTFLVTVMPTGCVQVRVYESGGSKSLSSPSSFARPARISPSLRDFRCGPLAAPSTDRAPSRGVDERHL